MQANEQCNLVTLSKFLASILELWRDKDGRYVLFLTRAGDCILHIILLPLKLLSLPEIPSGYS